MDKIWLEEELNKFEANNNISPSLNAYTKRGFLVKEEEQEEKRREFTKKDFHQHKLGT